MCKWRVAGCIVWFAAQSTFAAAPATAPDFSGMNEPVREFAATCMMHVFAHADLHAKLDHSAAALRYDDAQARPFLGGQSGAVWGVRGHASNYAVVLTDGGICSVDAQSHVAGTWNDFDALLKALFPGTELVPVSQRIAGPETASVHSKGYRLRSNGRLLPPIFTLTASTDPHVNFAERLTVFMPVPVASQ